MWEYSQPVRIIFGIGQRRQLGAEIAKIRGKKGMLVTSRSFVRRGVADALTADVKDIDWEVFSEVSPNPDVKECGACISMIKSAGCDFVVALGGGSVMDLAKAASALCFTESSVADVLRGKATIPNQHLPLIAMPTTAGTGSEVTSVSVLTDHEAGIKAPISSDVFFPVVAIIDPELTLSVPPRLTAQTGFDVLCHAIEAFWGKHHQPVCDVLAVEAAKGVLAHIEACYNQPDNIAQREAMALASVTAGLAFAIPKTSSAHACSYPLTNQLGIAHGEACALTISHFIRFNALKGCERTRTLATLLGFQSAEALADEIDRLRLLTGMRMNLTDLHLSKQQFDALVDGSLHPNLKNNPVEVTRQDLEEMYRHLCGEE